ncbi:MAG: hypothetical protein KIT72_19550 [Polyangiaceae bacterium]|nr:hypothetical protein [Polyangiaceae bacterium]MCW5792617.1 hypothetical protein [Polyangiaceae bacterium]
MLEPYCLASYVESCEMASDNTCNCVTASDCHKGGLCMTEPPAERCPVPDSCEALGRKISMMEYAQDGLEGDVRAQLESCLAAHQARASELNCGG